MSQDDLLSQEEIDALLKGVSGDDEPSASSSQAQDEIRTRPYDPSTQHRVIRERLHALDFINERFARYFRTGLFNLLRRSADITVESVRYQSFSEFSRNVPVPTNLNIVSMKPLRGSALVVFPLTSFSWWSITCSVVMVASLPNRTAGNSQTLSSVLYSACSISPLMHTKRVGKSFTRLTSVFTFRSTVEVCQHH